MKEFRLRLKNVLFFVFKEEKMRNDNKKKKEKKRMINDLTITPMEIRGHRSKT
jgi:hypothetical protein